MQETIKFQTRQRVKKLLDHKQSKKNLEQLRRAKYMRQQYTKDKKRVMITMEISDFKEIQRHAEISGITPTAFVRACTLAYMEDKRVPSQKAEEAVSETTFLLRNIANNLNQIARQSNTFQKITLGDFAQLKILLGHLEDTAESAIKKLLS